MASITTIVKHRVRTTGLEHQGQNSISYPGLNLGFTCIFSSGMQEILTLDISPMAHVLLHLIWLYRTSHNFVVIQCHNNIKMTSVFYNIVGVNAE